MITHPQLDIWIPERDRWAYSEATRTVKIQEEAQRRLTLSAFLLEPKNDIARTEFQLKCRNSVGFFARNCIWTKDPEQRMGCGPDLPLIPFSYMIDVIDLEDGVKGGGWLSIMQGSLDTQKESRWAFKKSRRMMASIAIAIFFTWAMRFRTGFKAGIASAGQSGVDKGEDFDALMGKIRYMWKHINKFYPWMFPELAELGTTDNKDCYLKFPKWVDGGRDIAPEMWDNSVTGMIPSEIGERGGSRLALAVDEAAWVQDLMAHMDNIGPSTSHKWLFSTPNTPEHPFEAYGEGKFGYLSTVTPPLLNPSMMENAEWDEEAEDLVSTGWAGIRKWRSDFIREKLEEYPRHVFERNFNINPRGVAKSRIFYAFQVGQHAGNPSPKAKNYDLYDPSWRTTIWYDVGRGDPWACWWVQVNDDTGEVNFVDYWMRADVSIEWWIPLWLGWNPQMMDYWVTMPDRQPWRSRVPWSYGKEDLELMQLWHNRYGRPRVQTVERGSKRPLCVYGDIQGRERTSNAPHSVEQIIQHYGMMPISKSMSHNRENFIDHANIVLGRCKVEGRIAFRRPFSGGTSFPSPVEVFTSWQRLEPTERTEGNKPKHDIYSHPGTAILYGAQHLPARIPHAKNRVTGELEPNVPLLKKGPMVAKVKVDPSTGAMFYGFD